MAAFKAVIVIFRPLGCLGLVAILGFVGYCEGLSAITNADSHGLNAWQIYHDPPREVGQEKAEQDEAGQLTWRAGVTGGTDDRLILQYFRSSRGHSSVPTLVSTRALETMKDVSLDRRRACVSPKISMVGVFLHRTGADAKIGK